MPLFTSASEIQINGGSFNDFAGDVNLHITQPPMGPNGEAFAALGFGLIEGINRQLPGADRNGRQGAARTLPYNVSRRSQLIVHAREPVSADEQASSVVPSASSPAAANPPTSSISQPPTVPRPFNQGAYTSGDTPAPYGSWPEKRAVEYPSANDPKPTRTSPDGHPSPRSRIPSHSEIVHRASFPWDHSQERGTNINGGTFIGGSVNHNHFGEPGLVMLQRASASDAFHDSAERYPQPRCHPETRTEMLKDLSKWSSNVNSESSVLWLHGPAGAGKSAIAQSLCTELDAAGRLGASFFFKRGHPSRGTGNKLFSTIAYQLALCLPELKTQISKIVEDDPSILDRTLYLQLQKLIIEPCRRPKIRDRAMVIIIDGLDECEGQNVQQEILRSIGRIMHEDPLPLRFLVASRPEPHIQKIFADYFDKNYYSINIYQAREDVRLYLLNELARIHQEHGTTMAMVPMPWPSLDIIETLVEKSSGYFIYASTAIKFIDDKHFRPTERLQVIMGTKEPDFGSPFGALDQLYSQILCASPTRPQLLTILAVIVAKLRLKISRIEQLFELERGDVQMILYGLHSVLDVPRSDDDMPITVYHASFLDFLGDSMRSGKFYVGHSQQRTTLARHLLKAFSYMYDDPFLNRSGHITEDLDFSAFQIITSSEPSPDLVDILCAFNPDFVFNRGKALETADAVLSWLKRASPPQDLIQLWEDYRFMAYCESIWVQDSEGQVYNEYMDLGRVLSQVQPSLIRILQGIKFMKCQTGTPLLAMQIMFNFSWDELRANICSLRQEEQTRIKNMPTIALDSTLFSGQLDSLFSDLACGFMRVIQDIAEQEADRNMLLLWKLDGWSYYLRSCPPSPKLLQHLCDIEHVLDGFYYRKFSDFEYHNIVQWLKTFPQSLELSSRLEDYLERQRVGYCGTWDYENLETGWWEWCKCHKRYLNSRVCPTPMVRLISPFFMM